MSSVYDVFVGTVEDNAQAIAQVWSRSFELLQEAAAQQKLEHSYLTNPAGAGPVFMLRDNASQAVVGVQGLEIREFHGEGGIFRAGIIADYAVDPAHRTLLPALQLLKLCIAKRSEFVNFLYGFPNRKAEAVTRRAGFENVIRLDRYAAPLRIEHYLSPKLPSFLQPLMLWLGDSFLNAISCWRKLRFARRIKWVNEGGVAADVDTIWSGVLMQALFLSKRSADVLSWRFRLGVIDGDAPWRLDVARDADGKCPIGYVVWSKRGDIATVGDFLCVDPARQTLSLLSAFQRFARDAGCGAISLEYCGNRDVAAALARAGFRVRDGNPLFMVGREHLPPADQWYFTGSDRDTD